MDEIRFDEDWIDWFLYYCFRVRVVCLAQAKGNDRWPGFTMSGKRRRGFGHLLAAGADGKVLPCLISRNLQQSHIERPPKGKSHVRQPLWALRFWFIGRTTKGSTGNGVRSKNNAPSADKGASAFRHDGFRRCQPQIGSQSSLFKPSGRKTNPNLGAGMAPSNLRHMLVNMLSCSIRTYHFGNTCACERMSQWHVRVFVFCRVHMFRGGICGYHVCSGWAPEQQQLLHVSSSLWQWMFSSAFTNLCP